MKKKPAPKTLTPPPARVREDSSNGDDRVDARLARHGGLSYLEIPAMDVHRSAKFYGEVLGWLPRGDDRDHPRFTDPDGHLIGRWVAGRAIAREPGLLPFVYVNRLRDAVGKVASNGGEIVKAPYPEGTLLVALIRDPAGNVLGLWQDGFR
jgi:predicted enzyme related to lactoylglutathione lyase